jgi:ATP-dependent Clp protease ATP-binding subunit ClpB
VQRAGDLARAGELTYGIIPALERQIAEAQAGGENRMLNEEVTDQAIAGVVSRWTGIPVEKMLEGERDKLLAMEDALRARVVGQDEAIAAVSNAVRRARAGLQDPNRPIGSFLFLGPTGVGKTELSKALAAFLFDDEAALIRIDMSEYMEKHTVARPYQVVLFDEIEKAHPEVFNVLLQVLDDGRLTDSQGHTVDFCNTVVILTSNLGGEILAAQPAGQDSSAVRGEVMAAVRAAFRPEFLNRIDETLLFHRLSRDHMDGIVDIQLDRLRALLGDREIALELDEPARAWLAQAGYDPVYGARPLKRVIQRALQNPLASLILEGKVTEDDTVRVSAGESGLVINGEAVAAEAA